MTGPTCYECGGDRGYVRVPHGRLCGACRRRLHYHPAICPGCGQLRPLGYRDPADQPVRASYAGRDRSVFACADCGREDQPYGGSRCARCILRQRLTELLTDPASGGIHEALRPLFDTLMAGDRPQTTIYWLRRPPGVAPRLLQRMASGQMAISHAAFEQLPSDRAHNYLRDLLAAVGVLPPYEPAIARIEPWLAGKLADLPADEASLVNCFARWRVLRHLRARAEQGQLTKGVINRGRTEITEAIRFLAWLREHDAGIDTLDQTFLDRYFHAHPARTHTLSTFLNWLLPQPGRPELEQPAHRQAAPNVTVSDEERWRSVELLLHDDSIRRYVRIAGLLTLLFAQPLTTICRMRTHQVRLDPDHVLVTFDREAVLMPPGLDDLIRQHLGRRGRASYVSRDNGWLFPGGIPGQPLQTENVRAQLVELGIKPHDNRKIALFQLAATIPTPVLADLIGIAPKTAVRWATLNSRSWSAYIAER